MRPIQNAGGEETIRERSYPVAKATAITAGQVVQLSGGKVVPAAAAQTAAILGIAGEDHSGTADILNPRADGDEILVCDNPGLIFECPVPTIRAASGSAATLVPASGDIAAGAADDAYNAAVLVLKGVRTWCYMCMNYIWPFPLRESYSPALFSPLSPRPPEAVVVSYVVVWKCSHGLRQIRRPPGAFGF